MAAVLGGKELITKDGGALACVHMEWVSLAMC